MLLAGAVAFAPLIGLNLLLWVHISAHGRVDIDDAAKSMLRLTESRLDEAMTQLVGFAMKSDHKACNSEIKQALGQAILKAPFVTQINIWDPRGNMVCSPMDAQRVVRDVSPANDTTNANVKFTLVDYGSDKGPKAIELAYRFEDGWRVSLLVPDDRLMPAIVVGRMQADFVSRLSLVDGSFVAARLSRSSMPTEGVSAFAVQSVSDRYPITLAVTIPSASLWASYRELFLWGNAGGAVLAFISILGALAVARHTEGPVRAIESAIRRGDFIPYYQPLMCIRTGRLLGCEALVRRKRPGGGVDGPGAFIPMVEATGQIFEITRSMMAHARDELGPAYNARPHLKVSFNLVADHFSSLKIVSDMKEIFEGAQVKMDQIVLEVTERQPLPNLGEARVIIAKLQELGIRIALDDVGTGHGGMSYLLKLGVDQMKMDKMFVDAIGSDRYSTAIIDTLVKLAADLNIEFVAEGVETFEQIAYLKEHGVDAAQGYVFAPPLPGPLYLELIQTLDPIKSRVPERVRKAIRGGDVQAA
ncbi:cyclic diguanylate phosphodiesterase [Terrihabitans soli]|uniref:Cyclic diguanylate phosphodiesterase n=1 Tax=Terrihabitans soli TaxID=708113 RepID=A0A6S6QPG4_9HYPH|nr:cyclic diguanylate phosphodiesterase [Terrihabitans soli]